jgi:catechol 2,3-dioxygenase-like lactoylglutathione lyase family enzyme
VSDFTGIDHVQLLCPPGGEETAREYWSEVVGLTEVPKAPEVADSGGVWFRCGAQGLHVGVEARFTPAERAHPALQLRSVAAFERLQQRLEAAGYEVVQAVPPVAERRMKTRDPFGNMVEFVVGTTG